jgi:hypothetical protein
LCGVLITLFLRKDYKNAHAAVCQWLCDVKFGLITEGARARTWVVSRLAGTANVIEMFLNASEFTSRQKFGASSLAHDGDVSGDYCLRHR